MIVNYDKYVYENSLQLAVAFLFVEFFELLKMLKLYDSEAGFNKRKLFWYSLVSSIVLFLLTLITVVGFSVIYFVAKS